MLSSALLSNVMHRDECVECLPYHSKSNQRMTCWMDGKIERNENHKLATITTSIIMRCHDSVVMRCCPCCMCVYMQYDAFACIWRRIDPCAECEINMMCCDVVSICPTSTAVYQSIVSFVRVSMESSRSWVEVLSRVTKPNEPPSWTHAIVRN